MCCVITVWSQDFLTRNEVELTVEGRVLEGLSKHSCQRWLWSVRQGEALVVPTGNSFSLSRKNLYKSFVMAMLFILIGTAGLLL
jgi:phosphoketolase